MKGLRVTAYDGSIGCIWVVSGLTAFVLSAPEAHRAVDTFAIVLSTVLAVVVAAFGAWLHSRLEACIDAPAEVVMSSRLGLAWRVLAAALPAGVIVQIAVSPGGGAWIGSVSFVGLGVVMLSSAVRAAGIERQRGGRLVRVDRHVYLAH